MKLEVSIAVGGGGELSLRPSISLHRPLSSVSRLLVSLFFPSVLPVVYAHPLPLACRRTTVRRRCSFALVSRKLSRPVACPPTPRSR